MNTARQATENMEYVRRLLKEKQPGFAASVELAVSVIRRQIERPEENDGTDTAAWTPRDHREARPVHEWRVALLARLGIPWPRRRGAPGHPADANHPATRPRRLQRASRIIKE